MKKLIIILIAFIAFISSCEKDDICLDSEAKTSRLIIRFKDNANHSLFKSVNLLAVQGIGNDNILNFGISDSIAIPLNVGSDISQFKFMKDYDETTENNDQVDFNYTRADEFVSRACGYRTIFENLTTAIIADSNNWILDYEISHTTVNNEDEKQLIIYH